MAHKSVVMSLASVAAVASTLLVGSTASAANFPPASELEVVATFDQAAGETPEDVYVDYAGNKFIALAEKGEIRKIDAHGHHSTLATLPVGPRFTICSGFYGIAGAMTGDILGNLYVSVASCDPESRGIWRVSPKGKVKQLTTLPPDSFPNGIVLHRNKLYIADSNLGLIWKMPVTGGTASVWVEDESLLRADPPGGFTGANGLQIFGGEMYTANTDRKTIVSIPIYPNGSAGQAQIYANTPVGVDDFAFDAFGNIFAASFFDQVLRIRPNGQSEVVVEGGVLDGPTSVAFGRTFGDFFDIYISSASFTGFSAKVAPNLTKFRVGVPGTFLFSL
jgi:sugar lactone lactonase YvrE